MLNICNELFMTETRLIRNRMGMKSTTHPQFAFRRPELNRPGQCKGQTEHLWYPEESLLFRHPQCDLNKFIYVRYSPSVQHPIQISSSKCGQQRRYATLQCDNGLNRVKLLVISNEEISLCILSAHLRYRRLHEK